MPGNGPQLYSRNIAALRRRQPEVAAAIEAASGPPARLVAGRDGSPTFLISAESGEEWLGGSSMPKVSAEEMFHGFAAGHENVFVPGIMAGSEVLQLAKRFGRHAAIFIVERCAYQLQLALRLYDFSEFIERGQVLILLESDFESHLLALFQRCPGYLLPARFTIPQRTPAEHGELQRRIERAGVQLARQQSDLLAELRERLTSQAIERGRRSADGGEIGADSRHPVAILSTDASEATRESARRLTTVLQELNWPHACCIPDRPEHCHPVARLRCMDEIAADRVILVNSPPRSLRASVPESTPIISWYFASARIPATVDSSSDAKDLFVVTSRAQQAQLVSAGVPEQNVHYAGITAAPPLALGEPPTEQSPGMPGVGADAPVLEPLKIANSCLGIDESASKWTRSATMGENKRSDRGKPALDALLVGDIPDDRADSAGITMSTHAALWRECANIAAEHITKSKTTQVAELLILAEQHCRAKLSDSKIRGEMIQKIEERVLPAAFARHLARQLTTRFRVAFDGANWPQSQESTSGSAMADTAVAHTHSSDTIAKRARWIVLPFFSTAAIQRAVDILSTGGCVALRAGRTPLAEAHPELRDIAPFIPTFTNAKQAVEIVSRELPWGHDEVRSALEKLSLSAALRRVLEAAKTSPTHKAGQAAALSTNHVVYP